MKTENVNIFYFIEDDFSTDLMSSKFCWVIAPNKL